MSRFKMWKRVPVDAALQLYRRRAAAVIEATAIIAAMILALTWLGLGAISIFGDRMVFLGPSAPRVQVIEDAVLTAVVEKSRAAIEEIEADHPAKPLGLARILPWNWTVYPEIGPSELAVFKILSGWTSTPDPIAIATDNTAPSDLGPLLPSATVQEMDRTVIALRQHMMPVTNGIYVSNVVISKWSLVTSLLSIPVWVAMVLRPVLVVLDRTSMSGRLSFGAGMLGGGMFPVVIGLQGSLPLKAALVALPVGSFMIGTVLGHLEWPNNSLLSTVREVQGGPDLDGQALPRRRRRTIWP